MSTMTKQMAALTRSAHWMPNTLAAAYRPFNQTVRPRFNLVFEQWFPGFAQKLDLREINELVQHKIRNIDIRAMAKNESIRYLY